MGQQLVRGLWVCAAAAFWTGCADESSDDNPGEMVSGVLMGDVLVPGMPDGFAPGNEATEAGTGWIQKGPLLEGSQVTIRVLDAELTVVDTLETQVDRSDGRFHFRGVSDGPVQVEATGQWFDEAFGEVSDTPITLRGFARADRPVYVNVFTHLAHDLAVAHVEAGADIQSAMQPSELWVHEALDLAPPSLDVSAWLGEFHLDHETPRVAAYTIWASAVVVEAAEDGSVSEWLDTLAIDLAEDHAISKGNRLRLDQAAERLEPDVVQTGVEAWFDAHTRPLTAPAQ